jgi:hypothetical protein
VFGGLARSRRAVVLLVAVWVVTRAAGAWLADHPDAYAGGAITGDPELYRFWASALLDRKLPPYQGVRIEYPPGALPFIVAPALWSGAGGAYRTGLIALMLACDALGLAGVAALANRWGSTVGAWLWVALVPLLGPIAYVRLDLVPAVASIWALERAAAGAWLTSGAWWGFGALAKLYPALLLPGAWLTARRPLRLLVGAAVVVVIALAPLAGSLGALRDSVVGYHSQRGIQVESTWGLVLLAAGRAGYPVSVAFNFGAFHVAAAIAPLLEGLSTVLSLGALAACSLWLRARVAPGDVPQTAAGLFGILSLILAVAPVLSPQFLLWAIALGAAAACAPALGRTAVLLLAPAVALSQYLYPFAYGHLLAGGGTALAALAMRNALLGAAGAGALRGLGRG